MAHVDYWKPINLATISYGQGIAVTPIQMVSAVGAICNDGSPHETQGCKENCQS
jgi:stage V sporulation protein D (sporulation-specific penicillin-binding protein)